MKLLHLICLLFLILSSCGEPTRNKTDQAVVKSTDSNLGKKVIRHHNRIDDINSVEEIKSLLTEVDMEIDYSEFEISKTIKYQDKVCKRLGDSLGVQPWVKVDFDGNGYTDLLLVGKVADSYLSILCILDRGKNRFSISGLSSKIYNSCSFPLVKMIEQKPVLVHYSVYSAHNVPNASRLIADTLVFRFGGFVEFNNSRTKHSIEQIEYTTGPCFGNCSVFQLNIKNDMSAIYVEGFNFGSIKLLSAIIDTTSYGLIINLLDYIDFPSLRNRYEVSWSDDQECTLRITYDNGKIKNVSDYGLQGTYGLIRLYQVLFSLKKNQTWVPDHNAEEKEKATKKALQDRTRRIREQK